MAENNVNKGGGSSSGDESPRRTTTTGIDRTSRSTSADDSSSEQEDSSSSDYEISLPDDVKSDSDSSSDESSSSASGSSSQYGGDRRLAREADRLDNQESGGGSGGGPAETVRGNVREEIEQVGGDPDEAGVGGDTGGSSGGSSSGSSPGGSSGGSSGDSGSSGGGGGGGSDSSGGGSFDDAPEENVNRAPNDTGTGPEVVAEGSPREIAEATVDRNLESGIEGEGVGPAYLQDEAEQAAEQFVESNPRAESIDDVAVRFDEDEGQLVTTYSRSKSLELVESEIEEATDPDKLIDRDTNRMFAGTEAVPVGVDLDQSDLNVRLIETEGGKRVLETSFNEEAQREIVKQKAARSSVDVGPNDIEVTKVGGGYQVTPKQQQQDSTAEEDSSGLVDFDVETNPEQLLRMDRSDPVVDVDVDARAPDSVDRAVTNLRGAEASDFVPARIKAAAGVAGALANNPQLAKPAAKGTASELRDTDLDSVTPNNSDLDTNVEVVDPAAAGAVEDTVRVLTSGDYFAPGAVSPSSAGGEATGRAAEETKDSVDGVTTDDVTRAVGGLAKKAASRESDLDTNVEVVDPAAAGAVEDTVRVLTSGDYFAPGAVSPSGAGGEATGRALEDTRETDVEGTKSEAGSLFGDIDESLSDIEEEIASGSPQGLEAGPRGAPEKAGLAGLVGSAGYRNRPANPVGVLVRRSPVGAPSRGAARTAAKGLGALGVLGGSAVAIDEYRDRTSQDEPEAATSAGFGTTQVDLNEGRTKTEVDVTGGFADAEVEVSRDLNDVDELEPAGAGPTATTVEPSDVGQATTVDLPGAEPMESTDGEVVDDSLVPGDYPLPGRDMPRNPAMDRSSRTNPEDFIETGAKVVPVSQQISPEEAVVDEEVRRLRRSRNSELKEILRGPDEDVIIGEPETGFPSERQFPTGSSAVVGGGVGRIEAAQSSNALTESDSVNQNSVEAPAQGSMNTIAAGLDTDTANDTDLDISIGQQMGLETATGLDVAVGQQLETVPGMGNEFVTETATANEFVNPAAGVGAGVANSGLEPDLPRSKSGDDRPEDDFGFFERDIIAPVEEDPISSIDESLNDL